MRKFNISFVLAVLLVLACGRKPVTPWTNDQYNSVESDCVSTVLGGGSGTSQPDAYTYCDCMLTKVVATWGYTDYMANETSYQTTLQSNGTEATCRAQIQQ